MRVKRTGIALVHEGELILPAAGSEAEGEIVSEDDRSQIVYRFPVYIEVRSGAEELDMDPIIDAVLNRLAASVEGAII